MQLNKKKKIPLICKIFDPKCFFHDFVKWTGGLPIIIYLNIVIYFTIKYFISKSKKSVINKK